MEYVIELIPDVVINLLCTFFGAYLGFKYAIKAEKDLSNERDRETRQFLLNRLRNELLTIKANLEKSWNKKDVILTYEFTSWKLMLTTGDLKLFSDEPYYTTMITLCSQIEFLMDIERNNDYLNTVIEVRKSVLDQLSSESDHIRLMLYEELR
ncbi:hypothetical protein [Herbinix luporum]|uniref:hypothetical protein n=1 Tax=Herbinix luporum TaxID=1679721 RepID=UPI0023EFC52B|nr:hypothetical protein [Herbinix luporum]